jgi:lycopene cyclase domain-containing protein
VGEMYLYLIFNILIILFPFLLSFERKIRFYKKWKYLLGSILIVGTSFIIWDIFATARGHWSFNEKYLVGMDLFGLPVEEIMFFITVPYACLFTYEVLGEHTRNWNVPVKKWPFMITGPLLVAAGTIFWRQEYTTIVLIQAGILTFSLPIIVPELISKRRFWLYTLITLGLFVVFNMVLTAIPIVTYGPDQIWGGDGLWNGRFFTIPLEDFIYNISMLTWYLVAYHLIMKCCEYRRSAANEE